tara:strand:+ start:101 stop:907 length:807 start_codon:yes stop_codon:yes gene_type:complete
MKTILKLLIIFIDKFEHSNYCKLRNIISFLLKREYKLSFVKSNNMYKKTYKNKKHVYYSDKKRAVRIHSSYNEMINKLIYSYCLENIDFKDNDVIIDCGANIGELGLFFSEQNFSVNYIGLEPSIKEFSACKLNNPHSEILNLGLWNKKSKLNFYIKSETADSSVFEIDDYKEIVTIKVDRLDNIINKEKYKSIKLLKIDAEGAEPEILEGTKNLLGIIEYISVDVGPERGIDQKSTDSEVTTFLTKNNFKLITENTNRKSKLFQNKH